MGTVISVRQSILRNITRAFSFPIVWNYKSGPGNVDGIATAYGLDGPRIEYRWRRDFPHPSRPHSPPPSSAEVKNRVELYLYSL
jgi:transposase-like protein